MKIKLIRTGGFIPVTKEAEAYVDMSDIQVKHLLESMRPDRIPSPVKDGHYYLLEIGTNSTSIDLEKAPDEYKDLFIRLKDELKIIKGS
jgi:hypothetical protein